jgi:hypothetical protein
VADEAAAVRALWKDVFGAAAEQPAPTLSGPAAA